MLREVRYDYGRAYVYDDRGRICLRCKRCGVLQGAEFCLDCRSVDPRYCAGGLYARDLAEERKELRKKAQDERKDILRVIGYSEQAIANHVR